MQKCDAMIIGGTGIGELFSSMSGNPTHVPTEFGLVRGTIILHRERSIFCIQRHGFGHKTPPHKVNFRSFACAGAELGVRACFSTAAVGSVRREHAPGTLLVASSFIDLTFSKMTLFDRAVSHTDFSDCFPARKYLLESAKQNDLNVVDGGCYVGLSGPRYESSSEIKMIEQFGGDVVGMTASTEAILFREAKVPYACLAVVTNFGCGMEASELNHEEVVDVMKQKGGVAKNILLGAVELV